MNEPIDRPRRRGAGVFLSAVATVALGGGLLGSGALSSPEALLSRTYQTALAETGPQVAPLRLMPAALHGAGERHPTAALWTSGGADNSAALRRPLLVGDDITISSADGSPQRLAVIELKHVEGTAFGAPGVRFQLVTCRAEGTGGRLVRFLMAIDQPGQAVPHADKTL